MNDIKTTTGIILICLLFFSQNAISEGSHFNEVEILSSDNETPSIKELGVLLNKYIDINDNLNKKPSYDSSIVKFMMSESILNGVVFNLIHEDDIKKTCSFLDSSKDLFVDEKYAVFIMLSQLGYSVKEPTMSASKISFSSMGYWKEAMRILETKEFSRRLKEYSENKGIVSLVGYLSGKKDIKKLSPEWSSYRNRPEFSQYISTHALYSHWAKHKIYCIYKNLKPQYEGEKLYDSLVAEASSDPWLSGKNNIFYNKHIWKETINLMPQGKPKRMRALRLVDAPEWVK